MRSCLGLGLGLLRSKGVRVKGLVGVSILLALPYTQAV
jgi:hypothetical protein